MIVTLLTDYGTQDAFVGVCHGVILSGCPRAEIVDITHGIPPFDVRAGALALRNALPYVPVGVHVAVVDPYVGTVRRAVALLAADGRLLVGPDNGLLSLAWERCGGLRAGVDVTRSSLRLPSASATFDGRDLFAPVAARLACGAALASLGPSLDPRTLQRIQIPPPRREGRQLVATVLGVDAFGNIALGARASDAAWPAGAELEVRAGDRTHIARWVGAFADVGRGELLAYLDAFGDLSLAVREGRADSALGIAPGADVRLSPR